jgi:hypothetical protein
MRRWSLAAIAACSILVVGAVWVWQNLNRQPMLTETVLAMRDHVSLLAAINDMCVTDKPAVANPDNSLMVLASVRAPLYPEKGIADIPKFVSKPTTFQMAAVNYSAELRDQRVKLDQKITGEESVSWWFKVAIVLCGGFATIAVGLKPLLESRIKNVKIDTSIAAAAIILTGTVGTLSSLSAFAETQASLLQHQRTLAQLQQLHWRVGNDVFAATDLCKNDQDLGKVGAWKYRFEEITNEAMPSISKPGDIGAINPNTRLP